MYAHASGFNWDEGLLVLAPIALVSWLLIWARRREAKVAGGNSPKRKPR
jgi:hypothetical protein